MSVSTVVMLDLTALKVMDSGRNYGSVRGVNLINGYFIFAKEPIILHAAQYFSGLCKQFAVSLGIEGCYKLISALSLISEFYLMGGIIFSALQYIILCIDGPPEVAAGNGVCSPSSLAAYSIACQSSRACGGNFIQLIRAIYLLGSSIRTAIEEHYALLGSTGSGVAGYQQAIYGYDRALYIADQVGLGCSAHIIEGVAEYADIGHIDLGFITVCLGSTDYKTCILRICTGALDGIAGNQAILQIIDGVFRTGTGSTCLTDQHGSMAHVYRCFFFHMRCSGTVNLTIGNAAVGYINLRFFILNCITAQQEGNALSTCSNLNGATIKMNVDQI